MSKNTKSVQPELPLPGLKPRFEPVTGKSGEKRWYYVAKTREQVMYALDGDGKAEWLPHDTIRYTPHLFSTKQLALHVAKLYKLAVVEVYMWRVDPPPWKDR